MVPAIAVDKSVVAMPDDETVAARSQMKISGVSAPPVTPQLSSQLVSQDDPQEDANYGPHSLPLAPVPVTVTSLTL